MGVLDTIKEIANAYGPTAGVVAGLIWLLWKQDQAHEKAMNGMVQKAVYEDLCKQRDAQTELLSDLVTSVAILIDRGSSK